MPSHDEVIVDRESIAQSCGHTGEFLHYRKDPYRARRREKFAARKCNACGGNPKEEPRGKSTAPKEKPEPGAKQPNYLVKQLPVGAFVTLKRESEKKWSGVICDATSEPMELTGSGPDGLLVRLATEYLKAKGIEPI